MQLSHVILSRTDNMGDAVLASPMARLIKAQYPQCKITYLGRTYVKDIVEPCEGYDAFVNWDVIEHLPESDAVAQLQNLHADAIIHVLPNKRIAKLAKLAGIRLRIGTTYRWHHLFTCNKLVNFSRRRSDLHECQLNLKLLSPFGIENYYTLSDIIPLLKFTPKESIPDEVDQLIDKKRFNLILHPGSKGRVWPADYFTQLIHALPEEKFNLFLSGTAAEEERFKDSIINACPSANNVMGKLNLAELLSFHQACDGILAASTGPEHTCAALGKHSLGLYSPRPTIDHRRWGPIGKKAEHLTAAQLCHPCTTGDGNYHDCTCLSTISVEQVKNHLMQWLNR